MGKPQRKSLIRFTIKATFSIVVIALTCWASGFILLAVFFGLGLSEATNVEALLYFGGAIGVIVFMFGVVYAALFINPKDVEKMMKKRNSNGWTDREIK